MPDDFPVSHFEAVYEVVSRRAKTHAALFEHFAGAWSAVSYRYVAMTEHGESFTKSIAPQRSDLSPRDRYEQGRELFDFFSNGFSIFEATFYGLFAVGAILVPAQFPLSTPKERLAIAV